MHKVLSDIINATRKRVVELKKQIPFDAIEKMGNVVAPSPRLLNKLKDCSSPLPIIAEVKFASPSEGTINSQLSHLKVADQYFENGATALSVLTEPNFFNGSTLYLEEIRQRYPESALLMKDFMIDEYQLLQAKAIGASCVLLIVAALEESQLKDYLQLASQLKLDALVEVHNLSELETALKYPVQLVGVNNRNLKTMEVNIETSKELISHIPNHILAISESGLKQGSQAYDLAQLGYKGFLVGTQFMKTGQPGLALKRFLELK